MYYYIIYIEAKLVLIYNISSKPQSWSTNVKKKKIQMLFLQTIIKMYEGTGGSQCELKWRRTSSHQIHSDRLARRLHALHRHALTKSVSSYPEEENKESAESLSERTEENKIHLLLKDTE